MVHPSPPPSAGLFSPAFLDTFPFAPDLPRLEGKHGVHHSQVTEEEVKGSKCTQGRVPSLLCMHLYVYGAVMQIYVQYQYDQSNTYYCTTVVVQEYFLWIHVIWDHRWRIMHRSLYFYSQAVCIVNIVVCIMQYT